MSFVLAPLLKITNDDRKNIKSIIFVKKSKYLRIFNYKYQLNFNKAFKKKSVISVS